MEETENSHNVSQDIEFDDDEDNNSGSGEFCFDFVALLFSLTN